MPLVWNGGVQPIAPSCTEAIEVIEVNVYTFCRVGWMPLGRQYPNTIAKFPHSDGVDSSICYVQKSRELETPYRGTPLTT